MVANLSAHKRGWDDRWEEFSLWAERGQAIKAELVGLVDADTRAFNRVMNAMALPRATIEEQKARKEALAQASQAAIEVPFRVMQVAVQAYDLLEAMATTGIPASVSDAGVGALCIRAAVRGAWLNVRINLPGVPEEARSAALITEGQKLLAQAEQREARVLAVVEGKVKGGSC
jgi:glutamate formiminotransferase/formiminotetrahydrofolate cyclodeaminase